MNELYFAKKDEFNEEPNMFEECKLKEKNFGYFLPNEKKRK